jgi:hypothetical protein
MAITYPLSLPTTIGIAQIELTAVNAVALSRSPFTFDSQVHAYSGQMWQADISLPPVHRELAESWVTFLLSLRGQYGTFLLGDPNNTIPRGTANLGVGTPVVSGTQVAADSISISGLPNSRANYLYAGDYVQFGSGSTATLHKVLTNVTTSATGTATIDIWPKTRRTLNNGEAVTINNPKGLFRLSSNQISWSINEVSTYGITFGATEAI